jgi:hypothetical protein
MKAAALATWLAVAAAQSPAVAPTAMPRSVLRAALIYAAKEEGAKPGACVTKRLSPSLGFTSLVLFDPAAPGAGRSEPTFRWVHADRANAAPSELEQRDAGELNRQLHNALAPPSKRGWISRAEVPATLRLTTRTCRRMITLSSPVVVADIAFVENGYGCGPTCGGIELLALRRYGSDWRVIAFIGLTVA